MNHAFEITEDEILVWTDGIQRSFSLDETVWFFGDTTWSTEFTRCSVKRCVVIRVSESRHVVCGFTPEEGREWAVELTRKGVPHVRDRTRSEQNRSLALSVAGWAVASGAFGALIGWSVDRCCDTHLIIATAYCMSMTGAVSGRCSCDISMDPFNSSCIFRMKSYAVGVGMYAFLCVPMLDDWANVSMCVSVFIVMFHFSAFLLLLRKKSRLLRQMHAAP